MRLTITLLGRELLSVSLSRAEQRAPDDPGEHDLTVAQVELAESAPLGFHIHPIPSLATPTEAPDDRTRTRHRRAAGRRHGHHVEGDSAD